MNILKRSLAMFMVVCLVFSMVPLTTFAAETDDTTPAATESKDETAKATEEATEPTEETTEPAEDPYGIDLADYETDETSVTYTNEYRILHLDCGRKYFTKDWIIALINEMSAAGYNQLQLAFGNDGLRFVLDNMTITANGTTYGSDQVKAGINLGNRNYYNAGDKNELTQTEMDEIIAHAKTMGIEIVAHVNMPGHMDAILDAIEYVGISDAHFTGYTTSASSLNLNNDAAVAFTKALLTKYVEYFASKGCSFFHIGADEFANDAYSGGMGFPNMGNSLYTKFAQFVNDCAAIVKTADMTPRAWNDGISFTRYNDSFDTGIQITYWSSGWDAYRVAPANTLRNNGHQMINTHGDFYYIVGKDDRWDAGQYSRASDWNNTSFYGGTISDPIGSMFCIWCDYPGRETETQIAANTRLVLRAMAAEMQDKDANSISTDVVSGGFNTDGSLNGGTPAPVPQLVTVTDQSTNVSATAIGLTDLTAPVTTAPVIEGATEGKVMAWEMNPVTADGQYTDKAVVAVPVPDGWNATKMGAFVVEQDGTVTLLSGSINKDGKFEFTMPHFSVGGVYETAPAAEGDTTITENRTINLILGETKTDAIEGGNYAGTYTTNPAGIASVTAEYEQVEGGMEPVRVDSVSAGSAYYLTDGNGQYLDANARWTSDISKAAEWTVGLNWDSSYNLSNSNGYLMYDEYWAIVDGPDAFNFRNGVFVHDWYTDITVIPVLMEGTTSVDQTTVTFTGTSVGTATVDVGHVRYTVNVNYVEKTINIVKNGTRREEQSVVVADYMDVNSMSNNYVTATWSGNTVTFAAKNQTGSVEMIIGNTKYTVNVIEEDLNQVADLEIEYWQTNAVVEETRGGNVSSKLVTAEAAHSEAGIDLTTIIPVTAYKKGSNSGDPALGYWRSRLLLRSTNEQTGENGDDETLNGTGFTKVRYWNGAWEVYTEANQWFELENPSLYQLVAYYMNDMHLADEVSVSTSDWGKKGNGEFGSTYLGSNNVSLAFQIVYEGGTTAPGGTGVELAPYTYFVDAWGNRGVGTIAINQIGDYQIWKITAETGEHNIDHNGNYLPVEVKSFNWDNNEMTVWEDAQNPVSQYTILNPATDPNTHDYYDNLRWDEYNESILIRIYIKAVETEDSLKVVYYDEKFGDTLVEYNVIVPDGSNFNDSIVLANTKTPATLPEFEGNANRKDATGYGIVNALDKTQNFRTDLTLVPEAVGKYNNGLYTYTGSEISADGTTITHYYTINTETLSPNFVADFGLPLTFPLSQVVGQGQEEMVERVTVNQRTRYGTLTYDATSKIFTYTPTTILQNIDVLSINIKFEQENEAHLTNVGVTPATTVYYGEQFLTFSSGWSTVGTYANVGHQATEVLGGSSYYGYDDAYAVCAGASDGTARMSDSIGDSATFTFTGTGIQVFANSSSNSGYVSVIVKNKETGAVAKVVMVDTVVTGTANTDTTGGQIGKNLAGLPVVSLVDLTGLPHAAYDVTISKIMDTDPVYIDGIRVFGTVDESKYDANGTTGTNPNPFLADKEDNPDFYEVRDLVLKAMRIEANESADYETLFNQIYANTIELGATAVITNATATYEAMNRQDLLDNGPKNELYLFNGDKLTINVSTDRVVQLGLKAPEGSATYKLNGAEEAQALTTTVDMFYVAAEKGSGIQTITVENTGNTILSVTLLKVCDDPNFAFAPLTEENIKDILADAGITENPVEPETPTYTMVELKGTDVLIDGTVFDYTGAPIEPGITVKVNGTELVAGRDYSLSYINNVEPGTATVIVRGIATASETLGYTGEVKIDYTIKPVYTMVEIKGTDVLIDGTVFDYTGAPIEPGITVKVNGTELVAGRDYSLSYINNVEPGTATVIVRGIATASETLGYTGEVKIDYTINAPVITYADAALKVKLVDYTGKVLATGQIIANGKENETVTFTAAQILETVNKYLPKKYAVADKNAISNIEVKYGDSEEITVLIGKSATLNITYVNLLGKKVGTAQITVVQTAKGYCSIGASQINALAPRHYHGLWLITAVIPYGNTTSIVVPVI